MTRCALAEQSHDDMTRGGAAIARFDHGDDSKPPGVAFRLVGGWGSIRSWHIAIDILRGHEANSNRRAGHSFTMWNDPNIIRKFCVGGFCTDDLAAE